MTQMPTPSFDGLYGDLILDHYRSPRNRQPLDDADLAAQEFNPFCGDRIELRFKLDGQGRVSQVFVTSDGCSIIQASSSMMSEALKGKTLDELDVLAGRLRQMMRGASDSVADSLGDLEALSVVRQFPVRIKCALLPWTALEEGLKAYRASKSRH